MGRSILGLIAFAFVVGFMIVWAYRVGQRDIARADAKLAKERPAIIYKPIKGPKGGS